MKNIRVISALMSLTLLVSGCNVVQPTVTASSSEETVQETSVTTETETSQTETTKPAEPIKFNPHVHTSLVSDLVTEDMWNSFYNMCDAIRAGEDTFECSSEDAYKWCTGEVTFGMMFPAACTKVVGDGYSNGVAKLKYLMDKDKFLERQKEFEAEIERILNEAIRSDYSDLEKTLGLYDYMSRNWVYDTRDVNETLDDFGNYACLMNKNGICVEISYAYLYLLLQVGVEAMLYETSCDHMWNYVVIGGKGYHIDTTWALHGKIPTANTTLKYFMMTEQNRIDDGLNKDVFEATMIEFWKDDYDLAKFSATDETFQVFREALFLGIDTEKNVIRYSDILCNEQEFYYGDL